MQDEVQELSTSTVTDISVASHTTLPLHLMKQYTVITLTKLNLTLWMHILSCAKIGVLVGTLVCMCIYTS